MGTECEIEKIERGDDWFRRNTRTVEWHGRSFPARLEELWEMPVALPVEQNTEERFYALADEWERATAHISSVTEIVTHPLYREVIDLGMKVVPMLLRDLQDKQRFWFAALAAITGIRPYDPQDAGNGRLMTEAWVMWGKRKGFI